MNTLVSTELDDFLREAIVFHPTWRANLSNGETVVEDDMRPGITKSAWLRLREYVGLNNLTINGISLNFRDKNIKPVPDNAEGYFFIKNAASVWGSPDTMGFYIFGYLKGGTVYTKKYKIPECVFFEDGHRTIEEAAKGLILNI